MNFEEFKSYLEIPKLLHSEEQLRQYIYFLNFTILRQAYQTHLLVDNISEDILENVAHEDYEISKQFAEFFVKFLKDRKENEENKSV